MSAESTGTTSPRMPKDPLILQDGADSQKRCRFTVAFVRQERSCSPVLIQLETVVFLQEFSDRREMELRVEAGFIPVEATHIASGRWRQLYLRQDQIGTLAPGKQADLSLIKGDPLNGIEEIENVETVFKAGIGYDSKKLIDSVRGQVGIR